MQCDHCLNTVTPKQPRVIIRPRGRALWTVMHADCYLDAEHAAGLALGLSPEHRAEGDADARAVVARGYL